MIYSAATHSFLEHTIDYPPPGDGWELAFVVATSHGRSDRGGHDGIDRGVITSMSMSSTVVGVWARPRTDADRERERRHFKQASEDYFNPYHHHGESGPYLEFYPWLRDTADQEKV